MLNDMVCIKNKIKCYFEKEKTFTWLYTLS